MKKTILILLLTFGAFILASAQSDAQTKLSPAAALLFKDVKTKLTTAEKNLIAQKSALALGVDGKQFVLKDAPEASYSVNVYPVSMNKNGKEEIFITESSSYFGMAGEQFTLYIKDAKGVYQSVVSQIGMPMILVTDSTDYPDLLIGGPGMEQPVWRYNGKAYAFYKTIKDDANINGTDVAEASKAYAATIK